MIDYENPIDVVNMNVIGKPSPPPGYHLKEDPPLQRFIKEVNRIWIAPALAGIPAFLVDNWWKNTRRAGRNRVSIQEETKGVGAEADVGAKAWVQTWTKEITK